MRRALSLAIMACAAACSKPQAPQPPAIDLAVGYLRQEPNLCVPTSAAMILAYYGDPQQPRRLKALSAGHDYDPRAPFSDFTITWYRDLVRGVATLGYRWQERSFSNDDAGFALGMALIEDELRRRHPVMIDLTTPSGHTVVVAGIDKRAGTIKLLDPNQPAPGVVTIRLDQLKGFWNEHAYGNDFRGMIVTAPRTI